MVWLPTLPYSTVFPAVLASRFDMVFDAPGLNTSFKDRYEKFKAACESANEYIVYVPHIVCTGYDHLIDELGEV